jgi:hypothetical protein
MSDNDIGQYKEPTPAPSTEEYNSPGKIGREAFHGYRQLPKEDNSETYGSSDDELRRAARDHAATRGSEPSSPVEEVPETPDDGAKYALSVKDAAAQLSAKHRMADQVEAYTNLNNLGREVDNAKILAQYVVRGEITPDQARLIEEQANREAAEGTPHQEQPAVEAPQAETPVEAPPSGISPKVQAALADPEIRAAIEAPLQQAEAVKQTYLHATQELADVTTSSILASWPELSGLTAQTLPVALAAIARENPEKAVAIKAHLDQASAILQANQSARAQHQAQQQQQLAAWSARESEHFAKMIATEATPERQAAVKAEFENFSKETGLTRQQLSTVFAQNPALNSAAFQKIMWDALSHRAAKRTAMSNPASRNAVPSVQKPGVAKSKGDHADAEISELRDKFKRSTGTAQIRAAVALHAAQRRARGG